MDKDFKTFCLEYLECARDAQGKGARTRLTWQLIDWRCWSGGGSLISSVCTDPPSLQQSLQGFRLAGLMLTSQSGATSPGVHAARLAEAQRASHAAAAARFADFLGAVLG